MAKTWVKLTEHNDWEGEEWAFFLQIQGNEQAICTLAQLVMRQDPSDDDCPYELDVTPFSEYEVDDAIRHATDGYMASHNKVPGLLVFPDNFLDQDDPIYKGQIADFIVDPQPAQA